MNILVPYFIIGVMVTALLRLFYCSGREQLWFLILFIMLWPSFLIILVIMQVAERFNLDRIEI